MRDTRVYLHLVDDLILFQVLLTGYSNLVGEQWVIFWQRSLISRLVFHSRRHDLPQQTMETGALTDSRSFGVIIVPTSVSSRCIVEKTPAYRVLELQP